MTGLRKGLGKLKRFTPWMLIYIKKIKDCSVRHYNASQSIFKNLFLGGFMIIVVTQNGSIKTAISTNGEEKNLEHLFVYNRDRCKGVRLHLQRLSSENEVIVRDFLDKLTHGIIEDRG